MGEREFDIELEAFRVSAESGSEDPEVFRSAILPGLAGRSLRELSQATGLSLRYCSLVKRGDRVPHPRHWEAFRATA